MKYKKCKCRRVKDIRKYICEECGHKSVHKGTRVKICVYCRKNTVEANEWMSVDVGKKTHSVPTYGIYYPTSRFRSLHPPTKIKNPLQHKNEEEREGADGHKNP